jgi:hypothetical protein
MGKIYSLDATLEEIQIGVIKDAFASGMKVEKLVQPAQWLRRGLEKMEQGIELTPAIMKQINQEGGIEDGPDPWFH